MNSKGYIEPGDLRGKPIRATIKSIEREVVDGVPRLVLYFKGKDKGLILTRQIYDDLTAAWGHSKIADEFFGLN